MSAVSIQLKHTQGSPTSIGTRQCITTKQQVVATYLFDWFILDNFVLGQSVWLSDRREILESIYRGARPGGFTGGLVQSSVEVLTSTLDWTAESRVCVSCKTPRHLTLCLGGPHRGRGELNGPPDSFSAEVCSASDTAQKRSASSPPASFCGWQSPREHLWRTVCRKSKH